MAEEKAPSKTENLIQVAPEFAEIISEALKSRRAQQQDPEVEGHAMSVEQFSTDAGVNTICGLVYGSN